MKKIFCLISVALVIAAALAACSGAQAADVYGRDDTDISVLSGQTFTIKLDENPTTGYAWVSSVSDETIVKEQSSGYEPSAAGTQIVGSGGTRSFIYKAQKAGVATITFVYRRSWEETPAETIVYNVTVK